ncbi:MAG: hypothetical protein IPJ98_12830 [Bryobacterales bacterium]|nr:hypothetical protein [Bryobacterales bacterium]
MGPFRLIRRDALDRIQMPDRTWGWTLEMQVTLLRKVYASMRPPRSSLRAKGGHSKIGGSLLGGIRAGAKILWTLGSLFLRRGPRQPVRQT